MVVAQPSVVFFQRLEKSHKMFLLQHPKPHVINNIFNPPIPTETLALKRVAKEQRLHRFKLHCPT
jgi:hypothetical protein